VLHKGYLLIVWRRLCRHGTHVAARLPPYSRAQGTSSAAPMTSARSPSSLGRNFAGYFWSISE